MHVMIHSSGPMDTGAYGQLTAALARELVKAGHEVTISAYWNLKGTPKSWEGITVLPGWRDTYGSETLPGHVNFVRPDLVLIIVDPWALDAGMVQRLPVPAAVWAPVDVAPLGIVYDRWFRTARAIPVAVTRWGQQQLTAAGFTPLYVPYMIDTAVFAPPASRQEIRDGMKLGDRFTAVIVAANQDTADRKNFDGMFQAWAAHHQAHPDSVLIVHTQADPSGGGLDLRLLASALDLGRSVRFTDQYAYKTGLGTPRNVADLLAAGDVVLNCSKYGSFEMVQVEAQACGTPAITTEFGPMAELNASGWKIPARRRWNPWRASWQADPDIDGIEVALEEALADRDTREMRQAIGRAFAMQYDVAEVMRTGWLPALERIEANHG